MSTSAAIIVESHVEIRQVFIHWDGYPFSEHGILQGLVKSLDLAWPLPRFEVDEFAAAVVATFKTGSGNVRIGTNSRRPDFMCEFQYNVTAGGVSIDEKHFFSWEKLIMMEETNDWKAPYEDGSWS